MENKVNMKANTMPRFILDIKNLKSDPDTLSDNQATVSLYSQKQSSIGVLQTDTSV